MLLFPLHNCDTPRRYSAQQECDFSRADDEFIALRSMWRRGWFTHSHALPIFPFYTITAPFSPQEVLRISLAWGKRFAEDAQIKCPLKQPLPVPSFSRLLSTSIFHLGVFSSDLFRSSSAIVFHYPHLSISHPTHSESIPLASRSTLSCSRSSASKVWSGLQCSACCQSSSTRTL
jgi:hypothetical protein